MLNRKAKKKKSYTLLDFNSIKAGMEEKDKCLSDIHGHLEALRNIDMKIIVEAANTISSSPLQEGEVLQILACKLSVPILNLLRAAIHHIPDNIPRLVNSISLRLTYIFNVFNALSPNKNGGLSIDDVGLYVKLLETYCPTFLTKHDHREDLWALTEKENMPYNRFLTPPVRTCLRCQKLLTMRNYPANVKLFTTEGPIPCSKITLECRNCSCVYRVCNFHDELGNHLYPAEINCSRIEMIEVSNVTYIDLKLYKWFPSLRYPINLFPTNIQTIGYTVLDRKC